MTWGAGAHGSTFGGNPVCCAAALVTLDIVEGLLPHVTAMGDRLLAGLRALQTRHPAIGEVRGRGLMIGVDIVDATGAPMHRWCTRLSHLHSSAGCCS